MKVHSHAAFAGFCYANSRDSAHAGPVSCRTAERASPDEDRSTTCPASSEPKATVGKPVRRGSGRNVLVSDYSVIMFLDMSSTLSSYLLPIIPVLFS